MNAKLFLSILIVSSILLSACGSQPSHPPTTPVRHPTQHTPDLGPLKIEGQAWLEIRTTTVIVGETYTIKAVVYFLPPQNPQFVEDNATSITFSYNGIVVKLPHAGSAEFGPFSIDTVPEFKLISVQNEIEKIEWGCTSATEMVHWNQPLYNCAEVGFE